MVVCWISAPRIKQFYAIMIRLPTDLAYFFSSLLNHLKEKLCADVGHGT